MLILETHRIFNFPGGVRILYPSSGSAHVTIQLLVIDRRDLTNSYTVLVRKCICQLGQAQSPEPKGYVQIRDSMVYIYHFGTMTHTPGIRNFSAKTPTIENF